jgi:hypothetical protein
MQFQFCWWGCQKEKQLNLDIFYFTIQSYIQSTIGDALTNKTPSFSLYSHNMKHLFLDLQNFFLLETNHVMDLPPLSLQFCMSFNCLGDGAWSLLTRDLLTSTSVCEVSIFSASTSNMNFTSGRKRAIFWGQLHFEWLVLMVIITIGYQCLADNRPYHSVIIDTNTSTPLFRIDPVLSLLSAKEPDGYHHPGCYLGWYPDIWISNVRYLFHSEPGLFF